MWIWSFACRLFVGFPVCFLTVTEQYEMNLHALKRSNAFLGNGFLVHLARDGRGGVDVVCWSEDLCYTMGCILFLKLLL